MIQAWLHPQISEDEWRVGTVCPFLHQLFGCFTIPLFNVGYFHSKLHTALILQNQSPKQSTESQKCLTNCTSYHDCKGGQEKGGGGGGGGEHVRLSHLACTRFHFEKKCHQPFLWENGHRRQVDFHGLVLASVVVC